MLSPVELHQGHGSLPCPSQCVQAAGFAFCSRGVVWRVTACMYVSA